MGFEEILSLDGRREHTLEEVQEHLRQAGFPWKAPAQVQNRLEWLIACGAVDRPRRGRYRVLTGTPHNLAR